MDLLDQYVKWYKKKYSQTQKLGFNILLVIPFWFFIYPSTVLFLTEKLKEKFISYPILAYPYNIILGFPVASLGLVLILWVIWLFYTVGKGTPVPVVPTQKLVVVGPFKYIRHPMFLGVILWICGLGITLNSPAFIGVGLIVPVIYAIYLKLIEEEELEKRFGKDYLEYKKKVPFIIPKF